MGIIKCEQCGEVKLLQYHLRDYTYKKCNKKTQKIHYFCSYECMRKAEKENPDKFMGKRNI